MCAYQYPFDRRFERLLLALSTHAVLNNTPRSAVFERNAVDTVRIPFGGTLFPTDIHASLRMLPQRGVRTNMPCLHSSVQKPYGNEPRPNKPNDSWI